MPIEITQETFQPISVYVMQLNENEAREKALADLWEYEQRFSSIGEIVGKTAQGEIKDEKYVIHAQFVLRQDIARQQSVELEKNS